MIRTQMVDVKTSNIKLLDRARRIFRAVLVPLTEPHMSIQPSIDTDDDGAVDRLIAKCGGSVKTAVIAARWGCGAEEAVERLEEVDGVLKKALEG